MPHSHWSSAVRPYCSTPPCRRPKIRFGWRPRCAPPSRPVGWRGWRDAFPGPLEPSRRARSLVWWELNVFSALKGGRFFSKRSTLLRKLELWSQPSLCVSAASLPLIPATWQYRRRNAPMAPSPSDGLAAVNGRGFTLGRLPSNRSDDDVRQRSRVRAVPPHDQRSGYCRGECR
jgi:hypothetical protein